MYDKKIDTFLAVAENKSFNKAAEQMNYTSAGVIKHINSLEKELAVTLFNRTARGVALTEYGKIFYNECHRFIALSEEIINITRRGTTQEKNPIRIGVSPLNSTAEFNRICQTDPKLRRFPIQIVSLVTDINSAVPLSVRDADLSEIGFGSEPPEDFVEAGFYPFQHFNLTCAVPAGHLLAEKKALKPEDLNGETIIFPSRGNLKLCMQFASSLKAAYPEITVETPPLFYDLGLINRCAEEKKILVTLDCWNNLHPGLKNLPVDWDWTMTVGLLWKKDARPEVLNFIAAFKEAVEKEKLL